MMFDSDDIFSNLVDEISTSDELEIKSGVKDPNVCDDYQYMVMFLSESQHPNSEVENNYTLSAYHYIMSTFMHLGIKADGVVFDACIPANSEYSDESEEQKQEKLRRYRMMKCDDSYMGELKDDLDYFIYSGNWHTLFRHIVFVKFSLKKHTLRNNILTVARLFTVFDNFIKQDTYFKDKSPFLYKNVDDKWKMMSFNRYEAIKEVGSIWRIALPYRKEYENKLVFYVKDFFYKDEGIRRTYDICRVFKKIMEKRHNLLIEANDKRIKDKNSKINIPCEDYTKISQTTYRQKTSSYQI